MHALLIKQQFTDLTLKNKVWKVILVAFQGHRQDFSRGVQFAEILLTTLTFLGEKKHAHYSQSKRHSHYELQKSIAS